jgi:hypothetical protein
MSTAAPRKQYECPHNKDPLSRMVIGLLGSAPPMVVFLDIHPLVWAPASGAYHLKLQAHSQVVRESSKGSTECHLLRLLPGRCQVERCFQLKQAQQP